ncbi:MAG: Rrf2 family transcriptional regulator [Deltaproteobacteria bacterium]|nr:Rrf2 family transcriptional regulator [Deltaproteobacteria bacterium]
MRLSTRSRYGTRLMIDIARNSNEGPVRINDIAKRQEISVKYLEQLIIPLKKAVYIKSVRGPKGGHLLGKAKEEITVGGIVRVLEKDTGLVPCVESSNTCHMSDACVTRNLWQKATEAVYEVLDSVTLLDLIQDKDSQEDDFGETEA